VPALASTVTDTALIFEGGGMRASVTSAVVQVLVEAGIFVDWVAGISAGASNLANYVSRDPARARASFTTFAADPNFGGWGSFLRGTGFFNAHYIYEATAAPGQALPFDFATFAANPARRRVGSFEAETGRMVYWTEADMTDLAGFMRRVRASSTMPILMPPPEIDGRVYFDGALGPSGGIALDAAQADGFGRVFAVLTRERGYVKRPPKWPAAYRAWFRRYPAVAEGLNTRWRNYNRTREELFDLESSGQALLFTPASVAVTNHTTDVTALNQAFERGLAQARQELPRWKDWLGA
jgi:predicted patatin/cPLA2 family phospholipase